MTTKLGAREEKTALATDPMVSKRIPAAILGIAILIARIPRFIPLRAARHVREEIAFVGSALLRAKYTLSFHVSIY